MGSLGRLIRSAENGRYRQFGRKRALPSKSKTLMSYKNENSQRQSLILLLCYSRAIHSQITPVLFPYNIVEVEAAGCQMPQPRGYYPSARFRQRQRHRRPKTFHSSSLHILGSTTQTYITVCMISSI